MKALGSTHILSRIVAAKRQRVERTRMRVPEAVVKHFAFKAPAASSLRDALQNSRPVRVIAEVKKASPSKGVFRQSFSVSDLVDSYTCLLYTSDAADERSSVDLGGRRI